MWAVAGAMFLGGLAVSASALGRSEIGLSAPPLAALALICIPVMLCLNAIETEWVARLFRRSFGLLPALKITIAASAANMLPLPGAAAVRVLSLSSLDVPATRGTGATLAVAALWLGMSLLVAASSLAVGHRLLAIGAALLGLACLSIALAGLAHLASNRAAIAVLAGVKLALTLVSVVRLMLCFAALGAPINIEAACVFALAGVLGSAASVFPAGLGVREGVAAALAPLVGVSSALAFLATALDRLVAMAVLFSLSLVSGVGALRAGPKEGIEHG